MSNSCCYLWFPAGDQTAEWWCSYRTVSRVCCCGQPGYVLHPTQEGGGQAGEDKHGGYSNNVLEERNKWGNRRREKNRNGKSDMESRGELEVRHLWYGFVCCGMFVVKCIEPEEDYQESYGSIEDNDSRS